MSDTDICNMALSLVGTRSTIDSLSDGSPEAAACAIWYDRLRRMMLRAVHWGFARSQTVLTQLGSFDQGTAPYPWLFKYAYPADCLTVRYQLPPTPPISQSVVVAGAQVMPTWGQPSRTLPFIIANDKNSNGQQTRVILSNLQCAQVVYTIDVVDTSLMDDQFQNALANALAYHIVIQLTGNPGERATFQQSANETINAARASDGNEAMPRSDHIPDWIQIRGTGNAWTYEAQVPGALWFAPWGEVSWSG